MSLKEQPKTEITVSCMHEINDNIIDLSPDGMNNLLLHIAAVVLCCSVLSSHALSVSSFGAVTLSVMNFILTARENVCMT